MTDEYKIGEHYYMPFWILLNYLDSHPPDPFVRVKLLELTRTSVLGGTPDNPVREKVPTCVVEIYDGVDASDIPLNYLLHKHELTKWADDISKWFIGFAEAENDS